MTACDSERFRSLGFTVMLQVGTESPAEAFATDALAAVLPDVRIERLHGQAPEKYVGSAVHFLLD